VTGGKPPIYADDYADGLDAIDANGYVPVPPGPGLGVVYDWDWITRNQTGVVVYE
jgi:L-alanine-DL-glutamate epimerase-like enolase superfamily enzyme